MQLSLKEDSSSKNSMCGACINSEGDCIRVEDVNGNKFVFKVCDSGVYRPTGSSHKALPMGDMFLAYKVDGKIVWRHRPPWVDKKNRVKVTSIREGKAITKKGVFEIAPFVDDWEKEDRDSDSLMYDLYAQVRENKVVAFDIVY